MGLISEDQADQDIGATPLVPETVAPTPAQTPTPSFGEVRDAAFAQSNILGSVLEKYAGGGYHNYPAQPGYSPYDNSGAAVAGYDPERFVHSESPEQTQQIKNQIDQERSDQETLGRAGRWGYAASMAAGAVDPITLTSMLLPGAEEVGAGGRCQGRCGGRDGHRLRLRGALRW